MVRRKGMSYMTPKELKKMEAMNAANEQATQEQELRDEEERAGVKKDPLEMKTRNGKGGHHW